MTFATGTATTAESVTLYREVLKLEVMLRPYDDGTGSLGKTGRFTLAQIDAQIVLVTNAITAANAA